MPGPAIHDASYVAVRGSLATRTVEAPCHDSQPGSLVMTYLQIKHVAWSRYFSLVE